MTCRDLRSCLDLRPQGLIRVLIGLGCARAVLAFPAGSGPFGVSLAATAVQWVSGAGSLILLALLDWDVREQYPGITSLFRRCSYGAIAGSLLPIAASRQFFMGMGFVPALAATVAGLALTLASALLLDWLLRDIRLDWPLPAEDIVMERLLGLSEVMRGAGSRASRPRPL